MDMRIKYLPIKNDLIRCDLIKHVSRKKDKIIIVCDDCMFEYQFGTETAAIEAFVQIQSRLE